jgi:hypothetical protein
VSDPVPREVRNDDGQDRVDTPVGHRSEEIALWEVNEHKRCGGHRNKRPKNERECPDDGGASGGREVQRQEVWKGNARDHGESQTDLLRHRSSARAR